MYKWRFERFFNRQHKKCIMDGWMNGKGIEVCRLVGPYVWNHENHDNVLRDLITNCCLMRFFFPAFHYEKKEKT